MKPVSKIEVLVHPLWPVKYGPLRAVGGRNVTPYEFLDSMKSLRKSWRDRIETLKEKPESLFVLVAEESMKPTMRAARDKRIPKDPWKTWKKIDRIDRAELASLARKKLGKRAIIITTMGKAGESAFKNILKARKFEVGEDTLVEGYGIYADACVKTYTHKIAEALGIPRHRRTVNLDYSVWP
jgi:hypothetical protein